MSSVIDIDRGTHMEASEIHLRVSDTVTMAEAVFSSGHRVGPVLKDVGLMTSCSTRMI